jgi:hypothetical protein
VLSTYIHVIPLNIQPIYGMLRRRRSLTQKRMMTYTMGDLTHGDAVDGLILSIETCPPHVTC